MSQFRKKPIVIEAEQYRPGLEDGFCLPVLSYPNPVRPPENHPEFRNSAYCAFINSLEGRMFIAEGDYIVTGIRGERYPCKSDIFEATYEAVLP